MYRPERMCAVCRTRKDKSELLRIARLPEGSFAVDTGDNLPGRGAYVCKDVKCIELCRKRRALDRSFKTAVPEEIYEIIAGMHSENK